jgi:hypothetical protein
VDDQLVYDLHAQDVAAQQEAAKDLQILGARVQVARWMVVRQRDFRSAHRECIFEYFSWVGKRRIHGPDGEQLRAQEARPGVEIDAPEVFALQADEAGPENLMDAASVKPQMRLRWNPHGQAGLV